MSDNPFASPTTTEPNQPLKTDGQYHLRSHKGRLTAVKIGFTLYCLASITMLTLNTIGTLHYPSFNDPHADLTDQTEQFLQLGMSGSAIICLLALMITAIATCMFMYRSNVNVRVMGATGMQFTPGWSVVGWFIPILNLFSPYQAMKEIQMTSSTPAGSQWKNAEPSSSLAPWWTCWILGSMLSNFLDRAESKGMYLGTAGIIGNWIAAFLLIIAGILLIRILKEINNLQFPASQTSSIENAYR